MDILSALFAADKAKADLQKSGGVGYAEWKVIFPESKLSLSIDGSFENYEDYLYPENSNFFRLTEGQKCKVVWNGTEYLCNALKLYVLDAIGKVCVIGNFALVVRDSADTGEPFAIAYGKYGSEESVRVISTDSTAVMSITAEILHPIDKGFLPETLAKTIDLDKYGIGEVILGLFMQGGDSAEVAELGAFWSALSVALGVDIHLLLQFQGSTVDIAGVTIITAGIGACEQVCFGFLVTVNGASSIVNVSIVRTGAAVGIVHVKVT